MSMSIRYRFTKAVCLYISKKSSVPIAKGKLSDSITKSRRNTSKERYKLVGNAQWRARSCNTDPFAAIQASISRTIGERRAAARAKREIANKYSLIRRICHEWIAKPRTGHTSGLSSRDTIRSRPSDNVYDTRGRRERNGDGDEFKTIPWVSLSCRTIFSIIIL